MRTFITVLQGESPENARTVLASEDERLVEAVLREVRDLLRESRQPPADSHLHSCRALRTAKVSTK